MKRYVLLVLVLIFAAVLSCQAQSGSPCTALKAEKGVVTKSIAILWTSGDRDVFSESIEPYCKECFEGQPGKELIMMAWGPSICLLAKDEELQERLAALIKKGLEVKVSQSLADKYVCTQEFLGIGIELCNMNETLSKMLEEDTSQLVSL